MRPEVQSVGHASDASPALFNQEAFVEIHYPIPYILKDIDKKDTRTTVNDKIEVGFNIYEEITNIYLRDENTTQRPEKEELDELVNILKGGVIYIGSSD